MSKEALAELKRIQNENFWGGEDLAEKFLFPAIRSRDAQIIQLVEYVLDLEEAIKEK